MQFVGSFVMSYTLLCGWKLEPAKDIIMHVVPWKHSEMKALEFLKYLEEMLFHVVRIT